MAIIRSGSGGRLSEPVCAGSNGAAAYLSIWEATAGRFSVLSRLRLAGAERTTRPPGIVRGDGGGKELGGRGKKKKRGGFFLIARRVGAWEREGGRVGGKAGTPPPPGEG